MEMESIIAELTAQRDRLTSALVALAPPVHRRVRTPGKPHKVAVAAIEKTPRRKMSRKGRQALSESAKRRWEKYRAEKGV